MMPKLELQKCVLGPVATNCYFAKNTQTREMLIVDPADEAEKIIRRIEEMQGIPVGILLTHGHFDHIMAVDALKKRYDLKVYACREEQSLLLDGIANLSSYSGAVCSVEPDVFLDDQEVFEAAGFSILVFHTPGHTPGSCCYYLQEENVLFSGDTLFCGSVGRTDFPGGSTAQIVRSIHRLFNELPGDTEVLPGHEESTTIAYEMRYNPFA